MTVTTSSLNSSHGLTLVDGIVGGWAREEDVIRKPTRPRSLRRASCWLIQGTPLHFRTHSGSHDSTPISHTRALSLLPLWIYIIRPRSIDFVFVLDGSNSLDSSSFNALVNFCKDVVNGIQSVGPSSSQVTCLFCLFLSAHLAA
jgi:hypothetical protein